MEKREIKMKLGRRTEREQRNNLYRKKYKQEPNFDRIGLRISNK
jgi:hypothetical protein